MPCHATAGSVGNLEMESQTTLFGLAFGWRVSPFSYEELLHHYEELGEASDLGNSDQKGGDESSSDKLIHDNSRGILVTICFAYCGPSGAAKRDRYRRLSLSSS